MNKKDFSNIILIIIVIIVFVGIGYLAKTKLFNQNTPNPYYEPNQLQQSVTQPPSQGSSTNSRPHVTSVPNLRGNSGITASIVCIDKIYEKPCVIGGIIIKTVEGKELIRQSAESQIFNVYLEPGEYLVVPLPGNNQYPVINFEPRHVQVKAGQFTQLKLSYWDGRR